MITQLWQRPATIERNNFIHKSLSCWAYNVAVGCNHACRFCYVPEASTNRMATVLSKHGVTDPDAQWGEYVFPRRWEPLAFMRSLGAAVATPATELNADGNRAVMLCTTTDPYQVLPTPELNNNLKLVVQEALAQIRNTPLNVRILTRSPLARRDFDLMRSFGKRLLFGMSLPTLNNRLAKIYEPKAPAPTQRLATLQAAKAAGLHVYVAVAPVYPECDAADLEATLRAVQELDPVTIFMEPINIRAENVRRIEEHARSVGQASSLTHSHVFASPRQWRDYAVSQLLRFETIAWKLGIPDTVLHLWPDKSLGSIDARKAFGSIWPASLPASLQRGRDAYDSWLNSHWNKISQWPK